jgi:hypothetical protein
MQKYLQLESKIRRMAANRFDDTLTEEFLATFKHVLGDEDVIDSILQISTDEGDELEIGFFTSDKIADVTLSNGKVYSFAFPLARVSELNVRDDETKWVLTIQGEKKFDYNVVKPTLPENLRKYESSLREYLNLTEL